MASFVAGVTVHPHAIEDDVIRCSHGECHLINHRKLRRVCCPGDFKSNETIVICTRRQGNRAADFIGQYLRGNLVGISAVQCGAAR